MNSTDNIFPTKITPLGGAALGALAGLVIAMTSVWAFEGLFNLAVFIFWIIPMTLAGTWIGGRLVSSKPDGNYLQPTQDQSESHRERIVKESYALSVKEGSAAALRGFSGIGRFLFACWMFIGRLIRTVIILGGTYLIVKWLLPENFMDIPIKNWTLSYIFALLVGLFWTLLGVRWWLRTVEVKEHHNFSENPFTPWFAAAYILIGVGAITMKLSLF